MCDTTPVKSSEKSEAQHNFHLPSPIPTKRNRTYSHIETDCSLVEGDEVTYKLCPIPPKMEKFSAVHVRMVQPKPGVEHQKWDNSHTHPETN